MVAYARQAHPPETYPNLEFIQMDAREIRLPGTYDIVFSNAALHWVDDHQSFLKGVASVLHQGGTLVVSCGGRGNAAEVFQVVRSLMRQPPWRTFFRSLRKPYFFYGAEDYEKWLPEAGFKPVTVRLVPKDAVHPSEADFAAWFRTTWMPYTQRVPEEHRDEFIAAVTRHYLQTRPPDADGAVHVRMVRLELDAVRV
jgi:trans-aconitate methyltransferase